MNNFNSWQEELTRLLRSKGYKDGLGDANLAVNIYNDDNSALFTVLDSFRKGGFEPSEIVDDLTDDAAARAFVDDYIVSRAPEALRWIEDQGAMYDRVRGKGESDSLPRKGSLGPPNLKNIKIKRNTAVMLAHLYLNGPATEKQLTMLPGVEHGSMYGAMPLGQRWGASLFQTPATSPNPDAVVARSSLGRASLVVRGLIAPAGMSGRSKLWKITPAGTDALLSYSERTGENLDTLKHRSE